VHSRASALAAGPEGARPPARSPSLAIEEKYEEVKQLIILGKERGYLLYDEINDLLPAEINTSEEIDELFLAFGEHGIELVDSEEKYLELKQSERKEEPEEVALDVTALEKT